MKTLREELNAVRDELYLIGESRPNSLDAQIADSIHKIMERHAELLDAQEAFPDDYPLREEK